MTIRLHPLEGIPEVYEGDVLATLLLDALTRLPFSVQTGDVLVVAQKIVSKAEGCSRSLDSVAVTPKALELAKQTHKDPRLVALILEESTAVVRAAPGVLIVRHRCGYICANAGIDASNVPGSDQGTVLLLPKDADASARALRSRLVDHLGAEIGILIADSFGRPWRQGVTNTVIGASGVPTLVDQRGALDRQGRVLNVTQVGVGDLLVSAAGLVMGESDQGVPAALISGLPSLYRADGRSHDTAAKLLRPAEGDLFL